MLSRVPIAAKVFIAPALIIMLMIGIIMTAVIALHQQQSAFFKVVGGSFKTSNMATSLLLSIAEVQSDVLRYSQLEQRLPPSDQLLTDLRRSIKSRYSAIDSLFSELKTTTSGSGEADAVSNISDFLTIHRAVALRILDGTSSGTMAVSTLMAHYQQLQSYIVELGTRTAISARAAEAEAGMYVSRLSQYILVGSFAVVIGSVLIAFYVGRAISRPLTQMISALTAIAAGNFNISIPGLSRRDELGAMARAVDVFASVSRELRDREQLLEEKSQQLEMASRHKSDFLSSMSHELRTPLNAILGFNEMLLGQIYGEVSADMQAPLAQIQTSGKHLLHLINNVLDLAKIEAGRMELALSDYSVHDTVESVRSTLRPLAVEKGLEFLASVPDDIPLAYGDAGRITQCLMNLAGNSLKFTKAGKVEISVELKDGTLVYRVADTGIGIPPDKIGSLFSEFKQTDATIASEYGGTGLGLSISRKFVEMHGGRIWAESELGKGSAFIFEIPLRFGVGAQA
jgi:signal transduction histidine kinase